MTKRPDPVLAARYRAAVPPPKATIYARWHVSHSGIVTCEPMPAFICPRPPEGFAVRGSPEDVENEKAARARAAESRSPEPLRTAPPAVKRIRPGR